jgi:hypothetical protein
MCLEDHHGAIKKYAIQVCREITLVTQLKKEIDDLRNV